MPIELMERMLDLLPIRQVFACMRVCRSWNRAARSNVRHRQDLLITSERERLQPGSVINFAPRHILLVPKHMTGKAAGKMVQSLKQMLLLKRLTIESLDQLQFRHWLIHDPPPSLMFLDIEFWLPLDPSRNLWPKLVMLQCSGVDAALVNQCMPSIDTLCVTHYQFADESSAFPYCPNMSIFTLLCHTAIPSHRLDVIVSGVLQLSKLHILSINLHYPVHADLNHLLVRLLQHASNWHSLSFYYYSYLQSDGEPIDDLVEKFVHRNPELHSLELTGNMTDATLDAISHLPLLYKVRIIALEVTLDGLLVLLRGASRRGLALVDVFFGEPQDDQMVEAEVQLMRQETGLAYEVDANSHFVTITRQD